MITKFFRAIVPALAAVALIAGAVHAQSEESPDPAATPHHRHWKHHGMEGDAVAIHAMLKAANLTDEQKQQVKQIFEARRAQMKTNFEQLKAAREQIASKLLAPGPVSASDLAAPLQQISQIRGQMVQARLADAIAIRNLLTPDQLQAAAQAHANFAQMKADKKAQCKGKHAPGPDAPDGADF